MGYKWWVKKEEDELALLFVEGEGGKANWRFGYVSIPLEE